jgi:hypothetical protein
MTKRKDPPAVIEAEEIEFHGVHFRLRKLGESGFSTIEYRAPWCETWDALITISTPKRSKTRKVAKNETPNDSDR